MIMFKIIRNNFKKLQLVNLIHTSNVFCIQWAHSCLASFFNGLSYSSVLKTNDSHQIFTYLLNNSRYSTNKIRLNTRDLKNHNFTQSSRQTFYTDLLLSARYWSFLSYIMCCPIILKTKNSNFLNQFT